MLLYAHVYTFFFFFLTELLKKRLFFRRACTVAASPDRGRYRAAKPSNTLIFQQPTLSLSLSRLSLPPHPASQWLKGEKMAPQKPLSATPPGF